MKRQLNDRQLVALVTRQLSRTPEIDFSVAVTCDFGWPAVIRNAPFTVAGEPNPNLLYLSCPYLRREALVLEDTGMIRELESALAQDEQLAHAMRVAQSEHAQAWRAGAGENWPGGGGAAPRIAAASSDLAVKCLHAHLAWHLDRGDHRLGEMILAAIGERWCRDDTCAGFDIGGNG